MRNARPCEDNDVGEVEIEVSDLWNVRFLVLEALVSLLIRDVDIPSDVVDNDCERLEAAYRTARPEWSEAYLNAFVEEYRNYFTHMIRDQE